MHRLLRIVRSRRLAVWLIAIVSLYAVAATAIPLGDPRSPAVAAWASAHPLAERFIAPLGLHQPFTTPLFLATAILLTVATAACSWERTSRSWAMWSARRPAGWVGGRNPRASFVKRVESRDEADALVDVALASLGRSTHREGSVATTSRNAVAVFGSPLFHWALVGLFLAAGVGQLVRSEGRIRAVTGMPVPEVRTSYSPGLETGALFGERFTGVDITVDEIEMGYALDGVLRGDSPVVRVTRGETTLASGVVYPNHPLTFGSVVIHRDAIGPAAYITAHLPNGQVVEDQPLIFEGADPTATGNRATLDMTDMSTGATNTIELETAKNGRVVVSDRGSGFRSDPVGVGESVELPSGIRITLDELAVYATLVVVNDPSVPYIYLFFVLAALGAVPALLFPTRVVATRYDDESRELSVWILRKRIDPAFPVRVRKAFGVGEPAPGPVDEVVS